MNAVRMQLVHELSNQDQKETHPIYGAILSRLQGKLRCPHHSLSRLELMQYLVKENDGHLVLDRSALKLLFSEGEINPPFFSSQIIEGRLISQVNNGHNLIAILVNGQLYEFNVRDHSSRLVLEQVDEIRHMSYPFSDHPEMLAVVFRQDEKWFAKCGRFEGSLPCDPQKVVLGIGSPKFYWGCYDKSPHLGIAFENNDRYILWFAESEEGSLCSADSQRFSGFFKGEPQFTYPAQDWIEINGERWEFKKYQSSVKRRGKTIPLFPSHEGHCSIPLSCEEKTFFALWTSNSTTALRLNDRVVDLEGIDGYPRQIFSCGGEIYLLVTDQRIISINPDGVIVLATRTAEQQYRDEEAKRPWRVLKKGPLWLIEQGDGLSRIFNPNKTWVKNEPLPLYKEIDAVNLIFHEGELHALAQYSGYEIGHFKWLVVHKE